MTKAFATLPRPAAKVIGLSNCELIPTLGSGKTRLRWAAGSRAAGFHVKTLGPNELMGAASPKTAYRFILALGAMRRAPVGDCDLLECYGGEFGLLQRRWFHRAPRPLIVAHTDGLELLATEREHGLVRRSLVQKLAVPLHHWLDRAAFRCADALVAGCQADIAFARQYGLFDETNSICINPGIDTDFLALPFDAARGQTVIYLGTWIARKAPARIARVIGNVMARDPSCHFEVIGASSEKTQVLKSFPAGLHHRILVHPILPAAQVSALLRQAKVKFLPSCYEGFGMALSEAMACGCAVVTTPTGFGADLRDGVDAFVRDFNDEAGMEENILRLLRHDAVRIPMATAGWQRVQELAWDRQGRRLAEVYSGWLKQWDRARGCFHPALAPLPAG